MAKTNILIILNGSTIDDNASLSLLRKYRAIFNAKIEKTYTFSMRDKLRRVIRLRMTGHLYSVYGPKIGLDAYAYTQKCLYFGFDRDKAYSFGAESEVHIFDASLLEPNQYTINGLLKGE